MKQWQSRFKKHPSWLQDFDVESDPDDRDLLASETTLIPAPTLREPKRVNSIESPKTLEIGTLQNGF